MHQFHTTFTIAFTLLLNKHPIWQKSIQQTIALCRSLLNHITQKCRPCLNPLVWSSAGETGAHLWEKQGEWYWTCNWDSRPLHKISSSRNYAILTSNIGLKLCHSCTDLLMPVFWKCLLTRGARLNLTRRFYRWYKPTLLSGVQDDFHRAR